MHSLKSNKILRGLTSKKESSKNPVDTLEEKYPQVDFDQTVIEVDTLKELLFNGHLNKADIQKEINESRFFVKAEDTPSWKVVGTCFSRLDDEFEAAVMRLEKEFVDREFTIAGEFFLIFGMRLFLSKVRAIKKTKAVIEKECLKYLEDLKLQGKIKPSYDRESELGNFGGWHGFAYQETETPEFKNIYNGYKKIVADVTKKKLPEDGRELLKVMSQDEVKFIRLLCVNDVEFAIYREVPILAYIKVNAFVAAVLNLSPSAQTTVFSVFKSRYEFDALKGVLKPEKAWLKNLKGALQKRSKRLRVVSKFRLDMIIKSTLDPHV